jgi:type IV secretory pathway TrbD component
MENAGGTWVAAAVVVTAALAVVFFSSLADVDPDIFKCYFRSC